MRQSRPLDALLSNVRQRILAATVLQPQREWYLSDLAAHLRRPPSSLQRDLARLAGACILRRRRDGNRVYFQADPNCPILPELRQLLIKTSGLVDLLRDLLAPLRDRLRVAFVHGSVARGEEGSTSDVDLLLIGTIGLADLAQPLRAAREQLGREVNAAVYTAEEFAQKALSGHHFISKVVAREKLFVVGTKNDLEEIVGPKAGRSRARQQAGT